jgi:hypothetical protein
MATDESIQAPVSYRRKQEELVEELREQAGFLRRSSESFDEGYEGEARRLAAVLRLLLHDHGRSRSLLGQLGLKEKMLFSDTAVPIDPNNLAPTPGLAMMEFTASQETAEARYVPHLDQGPPRETTPLEFKPWWERPVTKDGDGELFSRREFVMTVANKDGGTHVDPSLSPAYAALTRQNSMGWVLSSSDPALDKGPLLGNLAFVSVRQIAFEVDQTLQRDLAHLLSPAPESLGRLALDGIGRNDPCPCRSGKKYKKCHGA